MAAFSLIAWCLHTCNLWWGCEEVHAGCDNCYARIFARSKGKAKAWDGARFAVSSIWNNLHKWQEAAAKAGEVHRVFTGSMMDIGEKPRDIFDWHGNPLPGTTADLRDRYFREVIPTTPNLMHLLLTKRPGNLLKMVPAEWLMPGAWPANVMVGTSPANQETANTLVSQLIRFPEERFLSVEPLLGPIILSPWLRSIEWVIVGGESQHGARTCELGWIRSIIRQCQRAGTPCFVKQLGACASDAENGIAGRNLKVTDEARPLISRRLVDGHGGDPDEWPESLRVREFPAVTRAVSVPDRDGDAESGRAGA